MTIFKTLSALSLAFALVGGSIVIAPSQAEAAKIGAQKSTRSIGKAERANDSHQSKAKFNKKGRDAAKNLI